MIFAYLYLFTFYVKTNVNEACVLFSLCFAVLCYRGQIKDIAQKRKSLPYWQNIHMEISQGTLLALGKCLKQSIFLFSVDTEIFITYISYLGLATGQFMDIHNILALCYGGHNVPYMKIFTFSEYEFAFLLLNSVKLNI